MRQFTNEKQITKVERLAYTGTLAAMTTTAVTATGYLRPLSEEASSNNGIQYGYGFSLILECEVDIQEGDRLTIAGTVYTVRGVVNHDRGGATAYKRCLLLKPEN